MINYGAESDNVTKRAILTQNIKDLVEERVSLAPALTKLIVNSTERVYSPFVNDLTGKVYEQKCVTPTEDPTIDTDVLTITEYVGNAITDCAESLELASWDIFEEYRMRLMNSVMVRLNQKVVEEVIADATPAAAPTLTTAADVQNFLLTVKANHDVSTIGFSQSVNEGLNVRIKRAELHGKPFVACGTGAYVKIMSGFLTVTTQSSLKGLDGQYFMSPHGVAVFNLGNVTGMDTNQMIWGVGGVATSAYREDSIAVNEGRMTDTVAAAANDIEIVAGDNLIEEKWYIKAKVKNKNKVFSNMTQYINQAIAV